MKQIFLDLKRLVSVQVTSQFLYRHHPLPRRPGWYLAVLFAGAALTAMAQNQLTNGLPSPGTLAGSTDTGTWTLTANPGDRIVLEVVKTSGGAAFNPRLEVFSPTGRTLGAAGGTIAARLDLQADTAGVYTAKVSDTLQTGAGNYKLQLAQIPENFSIPNGDEGGPLTNGASNLGTIEAGDLDMWTVTANAGDRIVLQISKLAGGASFVPQLELFGPTGGRISGDSGVTAARIDAQAPYSGTYTILVSAVSPEAAGNYQLQLVQIPKALTVPNGDEGGALADGVDQAGTITTGDLDPWTFSASAGDRITLQLTKVSGGASFALQLELFTPDGNRRANGQGSSGITLNAAVETPGTYVALVSDAAKSGAGAYTLHLTRGSIVAGDNPLTNGVTVQKNLGGAGQTNTWTFLANSGDRIVLRAGKIGTGTFNPWVRLYSPNNILQGSSAPTSAGEIAVTATNTGTFTAIVSDGSSGHNQTGNYRLTLVRPGGPVAVASGDEGGALTNGLTASGTIDLGDLDVWSFTANAGEDIVVRMGDLVASSLTPHLRLYGPGGILLDSNGAGGVAAEVEARATNSGIFTVIATDNSSFNTGTGTYRIKLAKTGSPIVVDPNDEGGAMTNAITQTGSINAGDMDVWNFIAEAGQTIIVRMGELVPSSSLTPHLRLFGPDGALLSINGAGGVAAEVSTRATNSGTFTVIAGDQSSFFTGSGTYQLKLAKTGSPLSLGPDDNGGTLTNGFMHTGNVSIGGMEVWSFPATSGESIVVRMGELAPGSTLTPYLRIYGPEGALQDSYGASTVAAETGIRATNTGQFTVVAADLSSFYTGKGAYRLKLGKTGSAIAIAPNDDGGPLTNGWMHTGTVDIGDMDVWSFSATAGQNIVVRMGELVPNSTLKPYLRLFGPNGALLSEYGASTVAAEVSARATNTGVFTVLAADLSSFYTGSGTYRLKLAETASPIIIETGDEGGGLTGELTYDGTLDVGDMAVYGFTACAGDAISVSVTELVSGSSLTPLIRIYNRDGVMLKSVSGAGSAQTSLTAPASGTFTVVVADFSSFYTGSGAYQLTVNGLSTGLKLCPPVKNAGQPYVTIAGADPENGYSLLTTTNVDTPKELWDHIPSSQFDQFRNLNYTNILDPAEGHRFFRWLMPAATQ
jgi:hypothetical protein